MNISYLIQVLQNKITALGNAKSQAFSIGDLEQLAIIEKELLDTQSTFSQLTMLSEVTQQAAATNVSPAELFATGLEAKQNTVQGPSAGAIVNGYDISAYATDPLHEQKIQNLIAAMPGFNSLADIDAYIQFAAPGSPVTASMVQTAATLYQVDILLVLAIMQNDSNYGTLGVGARTNNPGNVGNTGSAERMYPSWEEGTAAVAEWLSRHRYSEPIPFVVAPVEIPIEVPVIVPEPEPVKPKKIKKKKVDEPEPEPEVTPEPEPTPEVPTEEETTTPPVETPPAEESASSTPPSLEDDETATSTSFGV